MKCVLGPRLVRTCRNLSAHVHTSVPCVRSEAVSELWLPFCRRSNCLKTTTPEDFYTHLYNVYLSVCMWNLLVYIMPQERHWTSSSVRSIYLSSVFLFYIDLRIGGYLVYVLYTYVRQAYMCMPRYFACNISGPSLGVRTSAAALFPSYFCKMRARGCTYASLPFMRGRVQDISGHLDAYLSLSSLFFFLLRWSLSRQHNLLQRFMRS